MDSDEESCSDDSCVSNLSKIKRPTALLISSFNNLSLTQTSIKIKEQIIKRIFTLVCYKSD